MHFEPSVIHPFHDIYTSLQNYSIHIFARFINDIQNYIYRSRENRMSSTPWKTTDLRSHVGFTERVVGYGESIRFVVELIFDRLIEDSTFEIDGLSLSFSSIEPLMLEHSDFIQEGSMYTYSKVIKPPQAGDVRVTAADLSVMVNAQQQYDVSILPPAEIPHQPNEVLIGPCYPLGRLHNVSTVRGPQLSPSVTLGLPEIVYVDEWTPLLITSLVKDFQAKRAKISITCRTDPVQAVEYGRLHPKEMVPRDSRAGQQVGVAINGLEADVPHEDRLAIKIGGPCKLHILARLKAGSGMPGDNSLQNAEAKGRADVQQPFTVSVAARAACSMASIESGVGLDKNDPLTYLATFRDPVPDVSLVDVAFSRPGVTILAPPGHLAAQATVVAGSLKYPGDKEELALGDAPQEMLVTWRRADLTFTSKTIVPLPKVIYRVWPVTVTIDTPPIVTGPFPATITIMARPGYSISGVVKVGAGDFLVAGPRVISVNLSGTSPYVTTLTLVPKTTGRLELPPVVFVSDDDVIIHAMRASGTAEVRRGGVVVVKEAQG